MKTILAVVAVVGVSYFFWNHYFSRSARIERAYVACIDKLDTGLNQARAPTPARTQGGSDRPGALAKGTGDAMTSMVQGMTRAMGGAMCGMVKETCQQDFDGPVCQAALSGGR